MSAVVSSHSDTSGYSSAESLISIKDEDFEGLLDSFSSASQRSDGGDERQEGNSSSSVSADEAGGVGDFSFEALLDADEGRAEFGAVKADEGLSSVEDCGRGESPAGEASRKRKSDEFGTASNVALATDTKKIRCSAPDEVEGVECVADSVRVNEGDQKTSKKHPLAESERDGDDEVKRRKASKLEGSSTSCPPHPGYMYGLCVRCGAEKGEDGEDAVPLSYVHRGLEFSKEEAERVAEQHATSLVNQGRLNLVLDLDLTLLNTCGIMMVSDEHRELCDSWLKKESTKNRRQSLFCLPHAGIYTKLRPFVFEFLDKLKDKFHLHIYTMGERPYALDMAKLLDPSGKLFDNRIVSRDDSAKDSVKNLDVVLGSCESTLIVDDTEAVWPKHRENLLKIERYLFFSSTARMYGKSSGLIETGSDECPEGGQLEVLLKVLLAVHEKHFPNDEGNSSSSQPLVKDVRGALKQVRRGILKDVNVVFSGVIPMDHRAPNTTKIWRLAEEMGATISQKVTREVTHVVTARGTTEKALEGKALGCCMVAPSWLEHCAVVWEKVDPAEHPVRK
ncbi:hypothetical protein BSKO_09130 [Bryopsis sp. KO-2023]|nr:hypothetical protein BSKO_09130 [Bryopsis sp. KO-2023]